MFIPVQLIDHHYPNTNIKLPVVNHGELRQRISDFIQKRGRKSPKAMVHSHLCKKLFQNSHCELAVFPQRGLDRESVSCGDLFICVLSPEKGVVLCFIPSTNRPSLRLAKMTQKFQGKNYPNYNEASICLLSRTEISFLMCEEGMIDVDTSDACKLQGLEISLLRYRNTYQTLFCNRRTSNLLIQPSCLMGEVRSNYILVDCVCKEKNFSFQIGIPVVSEKTINTEVCSARKSRETFLKLHCLSENAYLRSMKIFPKVSLNHHVACLPNPMFLNLPFGLIAGGKLLFSQEKKTGILKCTIISNFFISNEQKRVRNPAIFYDWQIGNPSYTQTNQSTKHIMCLSDPSVTIARKRRSKEFTVVGAQVKLICSPKGFWGVCFFRNEASSLGLKSEATTFIPCTKKKSSFVMGQAPSHSEQSSLDCGRSDCSTSDCSTSDCSTSDCSTSDCSTSDCSTSDCSTSDCSTSDCSTSDCSTSDCSTSDCSTSDCDPGERPSHGAKKRSADQALLWGLDYDSEEGTSQGVKKRPVACLGLKCSDQDPLWSAVSNPSSSSSKDK